MRKILLLVSFAVLAVVFASPAEAAKRRQAPAKQTGYCVVAERCSSILIDAQTGTELTSASPDKQVYPASLTKLMTTYLLFDAIEHGKANLSDRVLVSEHAASQAPMKLGLRPGQTIILEDALEAVTVKSANDAAVVIAEAIGGNESTFARMMTQKAHQLGMNRTNFRNASGLPDDAQVTSARDMALLARHLLSDFPRYRHYFGMKDAYVAGRSITGHNHLVSSGRAEGGKTGYINDSGYNLVAWDEREGRLLIGAVFGGRTAVARDEKMARLLSDGPQLALSQGLGVKSATARTSSATPVIQSALPSRKPDSIGSIIDNSEVAALTQEDEAAPAPAVAASAEAPAPEPKVEALIASSLKASTSTFANSWSIQVGAYRDEGQAMQALQVATRVAPSVLGPAYPRALVTETNVGQLYRAQMTGLTEREAKGVCPLLTRKGMQCLPMPPNS